jgi:predicted phosphatase
MVIIKNENVDPFDVDGCLVIHQAASLIPESEKIEVYDAVTKNLVIVRINRPMVRLLRESASRGSFVIVWSRGGYQWAADVVKALGLQDYVNLVMSKPLAYFDDMPVEKWLPHRVFIEPDVIYKQQTPIRAEEN